MAIEALGCASKSFVRARPGRSRPKEASFIQQKAEPIQDQVAREGLLAVHKVANEYEEHDEDVEMQGRREEEMIGEEQESLRPVSAFDGADDTRSSGRAGRIGGLFEGDYPRPTRGSHAGPER